jgi:hypothetical protein
MDTRQQQLRRMAVPQIVKAHTRKIGQAGYFAGECVRNAARLQRVTVRTTTDQGVPRLPNSHRQKLLRLCDFETAQPVNDERRKRNYARTLGLWRLETQALPRLFDTLNYANCRALKIQISPPHGQSLAAPHSRRNC